MFFSLTLNVTRGLADALFAFGYVCRWVFGLCLAFLWFPFLDHLYCFLGFV